jgi:hypothetical protein
MGPSSDLFWSGFAGDRLCGHLQLGLGCRALKKIPGDHGIYGGIVIFNGLAKGFFNRKP